MLNLMLRFVNEAAASYEQLAMSRKPLKSLRSPEKISPNFATKKLTADKQNAKHEC